MSQHEFISRVVWTGNKGQGTQNYKTYGRTWNIEVEGKPIVECSNDPVLGGDPTLMNPEDLLLSSLSACHMLWYLHLASQNKITVFGYDDAPTAIGETSPNGAGRFLSAVLKPTIIVQAGVDLVRAAELHHEIHQYCFIARSINFPVSYEPKFIEQ